MASRKKKNSSDLIWDGLVTLPGLIGFSIGLETSHSLIIAGISAGCGAGIGIGILAIRKSILNERLKRSGILDIDKMDGFQFEEYLGHLFRSQGYKAEVTRKSGDFGADLILHKDGLKIVVQAKRHIKNIGLKAVQEAQTAIAHYNANEAWVVSNRDYTEEAKALAKSNKVNLFNRNQLIDMILKMNPASMPSAKEVITSIPKKQLQCDKCGKPMVLRKGPKGEFWGCSGYPKCRNIKQTH